jgi:hypothetical protein
MNIIPKIRQRLTQVRMAGLQKKSFRMVAIDGLSEDYLLTRSIATHKTPTELIGEMVREKIAL